MIVRAARTRRQTADGVRGRSPERVLQLCRLQPLGRGVMAEGKGNRRGHGEGSVYWREDRQRWVLEIDYGSVMK